MCHTPLRLVSPGYPIFRLLALSLIPGTLTGKEKSHVVPTGDLKVPGSVNITKAIQFAAGK